MLCALVLTIAANVGDDPAKLAREYVEAVAKVNDAQARKPEAKDEAFSPPPKMRANARVSRKLAASSVTTWPRRSGTNARLPPAR